MIDLSCFFSSLMHPEKNIIPINSIVIIFFMNNYLCYWLYLMVSFFGSVVRSGVYFWVIEPLTINTKKNKS